MSVQTQTVSESVVAVVKKGRGRPAGSKNKPKAPVAVATEVQG